MRAPDQATGTHRRPGSRAEYIIQHHGERAWRVLDALNRCGPCDTWAVSSELFGDLEGIHVLHGSGETHAHLEHLNATGDAAEDDGEYRLVEGVATELSARTDESWPLEF